MQRLSEKYKNILPDKELETIKLSIPENQTPLWEYWEKFYTNWYQIGRSLDTIQSVYDVLRFVLRHTPYRTLESWNNSWEIQQFLLSLKEKKGWKISTYNSYLKALNTYFRFLCKFEFISGNPIQKLDRPPEVSKVGYTLKSVDVVRILNYLRTRKNQNHVERLRNMLFFSLLASTGARPKELLGLTINSISTDRSKVTINGAKQKGRERVYPIGQSIRDSLILYITELSRIGRNYELTDHLFISISNTRTGWTYKGLSKTCQRLSRELGFRVIAYGFRRHACTQMAKDGIPIEKMQYFMGHTRFSTTQRYISSSPRLTIEGVESIENAIENRNGYDDGLES